MARLRIRVTPRSSRNDIRVDGDTVRVWVTASPTDGQANDAVVALLADRLGVAKSRVSIVSGHTSRDKTVDVEGVDLPAVIERLGRPEARG